MQSIMATTEFVRNVLTIELYTLQWIPGGYAPGKPGKVGEFDIGRAKVREIRKSPENCGLPVVCYCSCNTHSTNIAQVLLINVDKHKMECK